MVAVLRAPGASQRDVVFSRDGITAVGNTGHRWYATRDLKVLAVLVSEGDAPVGGDDVCDVLLDGTTSIFTTQANRPAILAGTHEQTSPPPDISALPMGHWLEVEVVAVAPTPGAKLDVRILYE